MNTQLSTRNEQATRANCLRTFAGAPASYSVRQARQGSFLVLVIGTLALLAVITIVYVALGNQDSRTKSAVRQREVLDDVPAALAEYHAEVLSRDVFSMVADGSMVQPFVANGNPPIEGTLGREVDDAPGVAHDPLNPDTANGAYLLTSNRTTISAPEDARLAFTPWGGLHDWFITEFQNNAGLREDFAFDGAFGSFRLFASDPYLASTSPTYLNYEASRIGGTNLPNISQNAFTNFPDAPYMQQLDWFSLTNVAPDGLFVNLSNLRNNFDAPHDSSAPGATGLAGIGYGKTLLEPTNNTSLEFTSTNVTDWGFTPPQNAAGTTPARDDVPFYWTMRQRGMFMPSRVSTDPAAASNPTENPASVDFKLYQYADADGDGMLDSRWWEMAVNGSLPEDMPLPSFSGNMRWFCASRIVDLSGLINVNFAGDLAASPADDYTFYQGSSIRERRRNFVMPMGMTPADVDLRRVLMQIDSYANYKANPNDNSTFGAYEKIVATGLLPSNPQAPENHYNQLDEQKAMLIGSMGYANLRLANQTGIVLGIDPIGNTSQSFISNLVEDQSLITALNTPPDSLFLAFADTELNLGTPNNFDAMGQRPWQTMMFPTRPWLQSPTTSAILANPSFGNVPAGQFHGWLDWSSRRTINYLAQSRKLWNTSTNSLAVTDSTKLRFGVDDLAELLQRRASNDPTVTTSLEIALGARDNTSAATSSADPTKVDVLRSNRGLDFELLAYDPITDAANEAFGSPDIANGNNMRKALRRLNTDVRRLITTISGSRPLRSVASIDTTQRVGNREVAISEPVSPQSLSQSEVKINARQILDLPNRVSDGLNPDGKPPHVESAETAAALFFKGYFQGLAPYASLDAAWQRNKPNFNRFRTLFYGYRGAELATLTAGTMAVNMVDLADGPTPAPLMNGPQAYYPTIGNGPGQLAPQLQPVRPGASDPRNLPTIRALVLTDQGASQTTRAAVVNQLDQLTRASNNNVASVPGAATALGAMFPTWQAASDIEQSGTGLQTALDNLDASGVGKLAPLATDPITPVVNVIGIEPQVFLTQVTTMTVYFDNYGEGPASSANGYNSITGTPSNTVKLQEPNVVAGVSGGSPTAGRNEIFDGSKINPSEVLFKLVAFKLTNPFDRDVILGKPMFSDIPPNGEAGVTEPNLPNSPLELVVDASVPRYLTTTPNIAPNTDPNFPFRTDMLPIYSRTNRWSIGNLILSNLAGYPQAVSANNWNGNAANGVGVIGAYGRGDQFNVNTDNFRNGAVRVDHISDFNYIRFGSRTYMLMSLNEQVLLGQEDPLPSGGPQSGIDADVRRYRDYERPDVLVPVAPSGANTTEDYKGTYATTTSNPLVSITLNPIRVPAGKTIVAYALSEAPNRILDRISRFPTSSELSIEGLLTPTLDNDNLPDTKPYVDQGFFIKRVLENQIAAGAVRDASGNQVDRHFASDIFNPNGAYWIPMIWDSKDPTGNPNFPNPPAGFTKCGLQNLEQYVNPIPKEAAIDVNRNNPNALPELAEQLAQRTVTLWRTVRQIPNTSTGLMNESNWNNVQVPAALQTELNSDWAGTPASQFANNPSSVRRPTAPNNVLKILGPNDYRNDQMQDRLRIPARLDMSVAFRNTDVTQPGVWTNVPLEITDTNTTTPATNNPDKEGYSLALWSSVRRPSDPRSARNMVPSIPGAAGYEFLYDVPEDILPAYCLEAKYWEDQGPNPVVGDDPMKTVTAWNLVSESRVWQAYKLAVNQATPIQTFRVTKNGNMPAPIPQINGLFATGGLSSEDPPIWQGGAKDFRLMLGLMHGFVLGSSNPGGINQRLNDLTIDGLTPSNQSVLSAAPSEIGSPGYALATRTLRGTIDQKPNATIKTPTALIPENPTGPFELYNHQLVTLADILVSGRFTYAELTPQISQDADRERGNQSNNFYRDVDMRTAAGAPINQSPAGDPANFNQDSQYTRWVSTLRSADLLRPLGVGPLEAPAAIRNGSLVLRGNFVPRAANVADIQNNNSRYTTLGEALACALGYEPRRLNTATANMYTGQETRDINLLRSPYRLAGLQNETNPRPNDAFLLKPPPGALTGVGGGFGAGLQAGDDSSLTLLFDRGNLWIDRFVPFVDDQGTNGYDCVMDNSAGLEFPVGPGLPAAQMALEQFETPATDPQALDAVGADNKPGLNVARQGPININTAPIEVLRALPGFSPRPYVVPSNVTGAGNPRPSTTDGTTQVLGDTDWFAAKPGIRPILPINQNVDIAAGVAAYRDMTPVLMSRSAMEQVKIDADFRGTRFANTEPVAVPFLIPGTNTISSDPFKSVRDAMADRPNLQSNTQIPGINRAPGLRSTAELLSARCRKLDFPLTPADVYVSRWPSGNEPPNPRHPRWKAAPWNMDLLGFDSNLTNVTHTGKSEGLNSSFAELDGSSTRTELAGIPGNDEPYRGLAVNDAKRNDATEAIRGAANEYSEKLISANNVMNAVTNRSDVFAVWFMVAGFQRSDVEGLEADEPLVPSVQRRFLMVVDRSNVVNKGEKPRVLLMKEVPVDSVSVQ